jgi:hypothetical protein
METNCFSFIRGKFAATLKLTLFFLLATSFCARAGTTIDKFNRNSYGANFGWMDWYADGANGAVIGDYVCSGYLYAANVGWINLGSGSPANGIYYQNLSSNDFGVNQDGLGHLTGYAWGANIGWINFEQTYGQPKINLLTGQMSGSVWSANCGWISLSNATALVQTDTLYPGPLASNGLPSPWLLTYFGTTRVDPNSDPTGKGMTVEQDYFAGTNPDDPNSVLQITAEQFAPGGTKATLTWLSHPTRLYYIEKNLTLDSANWVDSGIGVIAPSAGSSTTISIGDKAAPERFYRVKAVLPLYP